jgi:hypothetical protein
MDLFLALILCHNVTPVYTQCDEAEVDAEVLRRRNFISNELLSSRSNFDEIQLKKKEF